MPVDTWESLRRGLRDCHDMMDRKLTELHEIERLSEFKGPQRRDHTGMIVINDIDHLVARAQAVAETIRIQLKEAQHIQEKMMHVSDGNVIQSAQYQRLLSMTSNYSKEFDQAYQTTTHNLELQNMSHQQIQIDLQSDSAHSYLHENEKIQSSMSIVDQAISIGHDAMINLNQQRRRLMESRDVLHKFKLRVPVVRGIIKTIKKTHLKQTFILAVLVGICLLIVGYYLTR